MIDHLIRPKGHHELAALDALDRVGLRDRFMGREEAVEAPYRRLTGIRRICYLPKRRPMNFGERTPGQ
jgi:hypothetical protein